MLEFPPSPRSSVYSSFLPPPPGIPDNRENARTARPIAMAPADGTRARRFSRVGPFEPSNGCKCEGAPPPNRFGSLTPACTMNSVWHGSRRCAWGQRSQRAFFVHSADGYRPAWLELGRETRRARARLALVSRQHSARVSRQLALGTVKGLAPAFGGLRARTTCCMAGLADPPRRARARCMQRRAV